MSKRIMRGKIPLMLMLKILNKKISTEAGVIVLLLVAAFAGWVIIKEYKKVMEMRFVPLEILEERELKD